MALLIHRGRRACRPILTLLVLLAVGCGAEQESALGELALGLTTEANGVRYRLANARFTLDGPEHHELTADATDELTLELAVGAYRLTLLEGFALEPADAGTAPTMATLISQNPAPVLITSGETARVTLRFALADGTQLATGRGKLAIGVAIGKGDAIGSQADCAAALRINEVDYEQPGSDDAEFVELLNTGACPAQLAEVQLELVNGSDGKSYGRYALADAGATLAPGERIVVGDPSVLALLPAEAKRLMLNGSGLQNGPDGVRLVRGEELLDGLSYGGQVAGSTEQNPTPDDLDENALARCPDGFDTGDGALDLVLRAPTPGAANACALSP